MPTEFQNKVYKVTKKIPKGKVSTYKDTAHALNCKAYQAVGQALNKNPYAPQVPCHRVIAANGTLGGFATGIQKKKQLLRKEGIKIQENKIDLKRYKFKKEEQSRNNLKQTSE